MFGKIAKFFGEVKNEVKKVVWPSKAETVRGAWLIFIFSVLFALFFLLVDQIFMWIFGYIFNF